MPLKLPEAILQIYGILEPFTPGERQRILKSVSAALGDPEPTPSPSAERSPARGSGEENPVEERGTAPNPEAVQFGKNFGRWQQQQQISADRIMSLFHPEDGKCTYIGTDIPGSSTKVRTINCYLIAGLCAYIAKDVAAFGDAEAVGLCKQYGCHDPSNHSSYRKQGGNYFTGDKDKGFVLTVPGLRAAAELVRNGAA